MRRNFSVSPKCITMFHFYTIKISGRHSDLCICRLTVKRKGVISHE